MKPHRNFCSWPPFAYQDLGTCHDWPVKKAMVSLSIRVKGNLKHFCVNFLSLLEAQNKELGTAPQVLLNQGWITSATRANH